MRAGISIFLGFVILVALSIFTVERIDNAFQSMNQDLIMAENSILAGDWENSASSLLQSQENWEQTKKWWAIFINHNSINNIEICYQKLEKYIISEQLALSLSELKVLQVLIKDVPESEELTLVNIF